MFQQWRILTAVSPFIFILYCLPQCVCSVYLNVSNPFSSFTVAISGQVCSLEHVSGVGFQFCGYFSRSINTTAVTSRPTNKYKPMVMKPMWHWVDSSYLRYISFYDKQKQVICRGNTSLASNLDVSTPAIYLKPPMFVSQALPILHTCPSPRTRRLAFRSPCTTPLGRHTLYPVSLVSSPRVGEMKQTCESGYLSDIWQLLLWTTDTGVHLFFLNGLNPQ